MPARSFQAYLWVINSIDFILKMEERTRLIYLQRLQSRLSMKSDILRPRMSRIGHPSSRMIKYFILRGLDGFHRVSGNNYRLYCPDITERDRRRYLLKRSPDRGSRYSRRSGMRATYNCITLELEQHMFRDAGLLRTLSMQTGTDTPPSSHAFLRHMTASKHSVSNCGTYNVASFLG